MSYYRCYGLSGDNKIVAVTDGTHADDAAAIRWAESLLTLTGDWAGIELWQNARLVHRKMEPA